MRCPQPVLIASLLAAAVLCGCSDPYAREGTWHAAGVNEDNLRVMLADPGNAAWGVAEPGSDGQLASTAITRLRTGMVKTLPNDTISKIGGGAGSSESAPPPALPTAGSN